MQKEEQIDVSVILPCKNEEKSIAKCISQIQRVFLQQKIKGEIIVADSSTDKTPEIAKQLGARVITPWHEGYGNAYLAGFAVARGKYFVMGDADQTYDFNEIPLLLEPLKKGKADLVLGSRLKGKIMPNAMPALNRYVGNPLLSKLLSLFFGKKISDAHTGFRAITRDAYISLDLHATGMEFASEMIFKAIKKPLQIHEVPITYHARVGKSKLQPFQDGWRHLRFMLLYAPNYLFLAPGGLLFATGFALMALLLNGPSTIGPFHLDLHPMIVGSFAAILGFQLMVMGLFTQAYAASVHFEKPSRILSTLHRIFTLERAGMLGLILVAIGFWMGIDIFNSWLSQGQGPLLEIRKGIFSSTLLVLGAQTIFSAFFLSILAIQKRD